MAKAKKILPVCNKWVDPRHLGEDAVCELPE